MKNIENVQRRRPFYYFCIECANYIQSLRIWNLKIQYSVYEHNDDKLRRRHSTTHLGDVYPNLTPLSTHAGHTTYCSQNVNFEVFSIFVR